MVAPLLPPVRGAARVLALAVLLLPPAAAAAGFDAGAAWARASRLEAEGRLLESAELFAEVARREPARADACWRAARSYWLHGERLFLAGGEGHLEAFRRAEAWAEAGLERDRDCGACSLWKYAAIGRLVEERGLLWGARQVRTMRALLEHGLAHAPGEREANGNSTLANVHYAAAVFYRILPEWFWLPMLVGARGDARRALEHIDAALAISPERVDYQIERGVILLCLGARRGEDAATRAGLDALERALALPSRLETDDVDKGYARLLLQEPQQACAVSRMGFLDLERQGRQLAREMRRGEDRSSRSFGSFGDVRRAVLPAPEAIEEGREGVGSGA